MATDETPKADEAASTDATEAPPEEASSESDTAEAQPDASADTSDDAQAEQDEAQDAEASDAEASDAEAQDAEAPADDDTEAEDEDDDTSVAEAGGEPEHRVTIEQLLKAGSHFGHLTSRWNPRMKPYIFMERNNIHIIDLMQTQSMLDDAADAARRFARGGRNILFAGTKKQAQDIVREHAESVDMPHMVNRWLGGTMTNFETIRKSIFRMEEIEKMERDGTLDKLKKKEKLTRLREHEKLENVLGGIRDLPDTPGAIFIVDVKREDIAVNEAVKLGIPIIAMVDTNGEPSNIDYPIPANDDALSSIELITSTITEAIQEGLEEREMKKKASAKQNA
ncbi:30S ribosomal protein S2 [Longimonas halophila]|uniref:Small ribosomal subunit protein uS2 n=1 Tax=Longimonas halophila TaxID=1469170 RepID=A0A2H3NP77_9BACT|nr:30S ribosomal protein S2 [Longimonas halophila]PEN08844.1 30S ribosomal protein S2 [Longimonas halophila]